MDDQTVSAGEALERDLQEVLREQDLLHAVVELVRHGGDRPSQGRLDAVLAGRPYAPTGLVVASPRAGQESTSPRRRSYR